MPALTKCSTCGFEGYHGFNDRVIGITEYYHSAPAGHCQFFTYRDKQYKTLAEAWRIARNDRPPRDDRDSLWLAAWDALILEGKPRKSERLFKQWRSLA